MVEYISSYHLVHNFKFQSVLLPGHKVLKFSLVIHQPIHVEKALINYALTCRTFVFEYHRAIILIQAKGVDTACVGFAGGIFRGEKSDTQQWLQIIFD